MSYLTEEEYNTFTGLLKRVMPENVNYWRSSRLEGINPLTENTNIIFAEIIYAMDDACVEGQKAYKVQAELKDRYERKR